MAKWIARVHDDNGKFFSKIVEVEEYDIDEAAWMAMEKFYESEANVMEFRSMRWDEHEEPVEIFERVYFGAAVNHRTNRNHDVCVEIAAVKS